MYGDWVTMQRSAFTSVLSTAQANFLGNLIATAQGRSSYFIGHSIFTAYDEQTDGLHVSLISNYPTYGCWRSCFEGIARSTVTKYWTSFTYQIKRDPEILWFSLEDLCNSWYNLTLLGQVSLKQLKAWVKSFGCSLMLYFLTMMYKLYYFCTVIFLYHL